MPVPQSSGNRARTCAKTSVAFSRTNRIAEKSLFSDSEDEQGVPTPRIRPKRVRVICTDPDATDSSTDDEETWCSGYVRKQIQDIYLDNYRSPSTGVVESNNGGRPSRTIVSVEPGFRQADCSQFLNFVKKNGEWYTEKFLEWTLAKAPETTAAKTCVTNSEVCNSHKGERVNKSRKFRGVRLRAWGKWAAEIRESSCSRLWLGSFDSAEEAALAYDRAARKIHGPRAITNFSEARFQELTRPKSRKRSVSDEVDSEEAGLAYDKPFRRLRGPHASTNLSAARFQESGSRKSRKRSVRDEVGSSDPQLERYDKSLGRIGKSAKISTNICASKCAPMSFSEKSEIFNLKDMFCASSPSSVLVECLSSGSLESPGASSPSSSSQDMNSSPEYLNCSSFKEVSSQPQPRCLFQGDDSSATAQVSCLPGLSSSSLLEDAPGFSGDQQFKVFQTLPCQNELISAAGTEQDIMEIGSKLYAEDFDMEFGSLNFLDHGESVVDLADVADLFNEEDYAGLLSFENDANALSSWLSFPDSSY